jgi:hypothetical protein
MIGPSTGFWPIRGLPLGPTNPLIYAPSVVY